MDHAEEVLSLYRPATYCIDLPDSAGRREAIEQGLIEWVPGPGWGGSRTFALTDKGRKACEALELEEWR